MSDGRIKTVHVLLTDAIHELDSIAMRLRVIAEMLLEARNREAGLDIRTDEERRVDET